MYSTRVKSVVFFLISLFLLFGACQNQKMSGQSAEATEEGISLLIMITCPEMAFLSEGKYGDRKVGPHFVVRQDQAHVVVFSDRPHRLAKTMPGGIEHFAALYTKSDFVKDPPNATFAGNEEKTKQERYTVIEFDQPFAFQAGSEKGLLVVIPVQKAIGSEKLPPFGSYNDCSMVVDDLFGAIIGWTETVAAGVATGVACTVGEVATLGADTAVCVAGIVGTAASAANAIKETASK